MKLLYAQSNIEEVVRQENFRTFSFDFYDDEQIIPGLGKTARQHMGQVVELCQRFIHRFRCV